LVANPAARRDLVRLVDAKGNNFPRGAHGIPLFGSSAMSFEGSVPKRWAVPKAMPFVPDENRIVCVAVDFTLALVSGDAASVIARRWQNGPRHRSKKRAVVGKDTAKGFPKAPSTTTKLGRTWCRIGSISPFSVEGGARFYRSAPRRMIPRGMIDGLTTKRRRRRRRR